MLAFTVILKLEKEYKMIELKSVDIKEFKKNLYSQYMKLFPKNERKPLSLLKECYVRKILTILEIIDDKQIVGFMILNKLPKSKYLQLDYFAIFEQYQSKGYGSKALRKLQEISTRYNGIYIEAEKPDEAEDGVKNKRIKFYERLGCYKLNLSLDLFNVIYTILILPTSDKREDDDTIMKDIFDIYIEVAGKKAVKNIVKL